MCTIASLSTLNKGFFAALLARDQTFGSLRSIWTDATTRISFCINKQDTWQKNTAPGTEPYRRKQGLVTDRVGWIIICFAANSVEERRRYEAECTWDACQGLDGNGYMMAMSTWEVFEYWTRELGRVSEPGCALWHGSGQLAFFLFCHLSCAQGSCRGIRARRPRGGAGGKRVRWKRINKCFVKKRVWPRAHLAVWPEPAWAPRLPGRVDTRLHLGHSATPPPGSSTSRSRCSRPGSASARRSAATASRPARGAAASPRPRRRRTRRPPSARSSAGARRPLSPWRASRTTAPHAGSPGWSGRWWCNWSWRGCPPGGPETDWPFALAAYSLQTIKGEGRDRERADSHSFGCREMWASVTGTQCNFCFATDDLLLGLFLLAAGKR